MSPNAKDFDPKHGSQPKTSPKPAAPASAPVKPAAKGATFRVKPPAQEGDDLEVVLDSGHEHYKIGKDGTVALPARAAEEVIRRGGTLEG